MKGKKRAPRASREPPTQKLGWGASIKRLAVFRWLTALFGNRPKIARMSPIKRFLLVFGATALLGFAIEVIPWVDDHVIKPYIAAIAALASNLIHLAGGLADVNKTILQHPVNGFSIMVANGCSGLEAVILLAAGMTAFPATWRQRSLGWTVGTTALITLNVARIISLYYLGQYSRAWFDWAHFYAWDALIIVDALVVFFLWIKWLPPFQHPRHASTKE